MYKDNENDLVEVEINPIKEWEIIIGELSELDKKIKIKEIELALRQAEENDDEQGIFKLMNKLKDLLRR